MIAATLKALLLWLMLLNPALLGLYVAAGSMAGFTGHYVAGIPHVHALFATSKDAEQDEHMRNIDHRFEEDERQRAERRIESQAWNNRQDLELKDLSDSMHNVYGYGGGAFAILTVLQVVGLLKKQKGE